MFQGWFDIDWGRIFLPSAPIGELLVRGSAMYLTIFVLLRVVLKRQSSAVGLTDLLILVLVSGAAQNALMASHSAIGDSVITSMVIIVWSYVLDWLGFHVPLLQRFFRPPPLPLVRAGQPQWRNMRRELITMGELMSQLRAQGVGALAEVELACMEGDGNISVITRDHATHSATSLSEKI